MHFKLKKTITGSSAAPRRSPVAYSPNASQTTPKASKPRDASKILNKMVDKLLILALSAIFLYGLFCRAAPVVSVTSNTYHTLSDYQAYATSLTSGLTYRTKLSYNQKAVTENLQKKFPEISQASVHLPLLSQRIKIDLNISAPAFVLSSNSTSYLLDDSGRLVAKTATTPSGLVVIKDQSGLKVASGDQVLSPDSVGFLSAVEAQLKRAKVPVGYISLPPLAQEFDLYTTDKPYYTKFYLGGDALVESGQFLAARHQFSQTHQDPSQYLDVRVAGKIFYK